MRRTYVSARPVTNRKRGGYYETLLISVAHHLQNSGRAADRWASRRVVGEEG
jgi:hypothetical protein